MQNKILIAVVSLLIWPQLSCQSNNTVNPEQPQSQACKKITISIDGDETEYIFDNDGRLSHYLGESTLDAYTKGEWKVNIGNTHFDYKKGYFLKIDGLDDSGNGYKSVRNYISNKIYGDEIFGYENNQVITYNDIGYFYNDDAFNAVRIVEVSEVEGETVYTRNSTIAYTNLLSPFAEQPLQSIIEQGLTPAGNTNKNLADLETYTLTNTDPDIKSVTKGRIKYTYTFTSAKLLSSIVIVDESEQEITYSSGETVTIPNRKVKNVQFFYDCN